jgi:saccharopine dehydrogenase-like NADP-dependent oxidoreductase
VYLPIPPAKLVGADATTITDQALWDLVAKKAQLAGLSESDRKHVSMGFKWLGLLSAAKQAPRRGTLLDSLCATLEEMMMYKDGERDMVMLQHNFLVENKDGRSE